MSKRDPRSENDVKEHVKDWFDGMEAWHYAPVQTALGVHGIHDRIGCVPIVVTQEMVGKTIGLYVSVEAKRPGRRGEKRRGMTAHQEDNLNDTITAGGLSICCDGLDDLAVLDRQLLDLITVPLNG